MEQFIHLFAAEMVNTFDRHFDKFWSYQDVMYNNYKPDLHGIDKRSITI